MPKQLQGLLALEKRLPTDHKEWKNVQSQIYNRKSGFGGEQHFDDKMTEFKPTYSHAVLHGISLKHNGVFFEMDSILITPAFIIIFEVKNIGEKLTLSSNPSQFIKETSDGNRKSMRSPVVELERKEHHLKEWLAEREIHIPISKVAVFAYSNELTVNNIKGTKVAFAYEIPAYLRTLPVNKSILTKAEIHGLANKMKNCHDEYNPFPMVLTMNIKPTEIHPGVICPECTLIGMVWKGKKWHCTRCKHTGITEHIESVKDWFMLIDSKMTNRQFRYFTNTENRNVARRLLAKSNLEMKGKRRSSYYIMDKKKTLREI